VVDIVVMKPFDNARCIFKRLLLFKPYPEEFMKHIFLYLACVLFSASAADLHAQSLPFTSLAGCFVTQHMNASLNKSDLVYVPDTVTVYSSSNTVRYKMTYNATGLPTITAVDFLSGGQWVNYSRLTVTYDAKGNSLSRLLEYKSGGVWTNSTFETWSYDAKGNSVVVLQTWTASQWVNTKKDSSTFDAKGKMLVHLFSAWKTNHWQDSIFSVRTYDANEGMLTNIGKYMTNGQWVNHDQSSYTNNSQGKPLTFYLQLWVAGGWTNSELHTYTYDGHGYLGTEKTQSWSNNKWNDDSQIGYTNTYDGNGNILTQLIQSYPNGVATNQVQFTYTYDANGNKKTGLSYAWKNGNWTPSDGSFILTLYGDDYYFTGYSINVSYTLVASTGVSANTGAAVTEYSLFQNYPNPFNPATTIRFELPAASHVKLTVFDALGREVRMLVNELRQPGRYEALFDATDLSSGVYFYRIEAGSYIQSRKFILLK
jgi:hypothetical protein